MGKLVIAGGGFAGTWAAMAAAAKRDELGADDIGIELVSADETLCIRPRLYEGTDETMKVPLRPLLEEIGVAFTVQPVASAGDGVLTCGNGDTIRADRLILATGSSIRLPDIPGAAEHGFAADTFESTAKLDRHLEDRQHAGSPLTVVVVGASFTGLEIATKLRLRLGADAKIHLLDISEKPGHGLGENLRETIATALAEADVAFLGNSSIEKVTAQGVVLAGGKTIATETVIFATGFLASPLAASSRLETDCSGRLPVDPFLRVKGWNKTFAAGDIAAAMVDDNNRALMSCQHAMPMGKTAGRNAVLALAGKEQEAYTQPFYATCLDLGPFGAVFTNGWDRKIVATRQEGAEMKVKINTNWIYPPTPDLGQEGIFRYIRA
ncbi:NAD(P)/FAD-dependent oxidoreductase [Roseibium sp.]|uniref:NAD(P)/FAD-dependent oxidoreductase n=1 Tax=Roseibium sp. TaxID=1936156 RepID=UPI003D11128D